MILIFYALAATRLTGLITTDEITRPIREKLVNRFDSDRRAHRWVAYLIGGADDQADGCPWCASIWVGAITAPIIYLWYDLPAVVIVLLALAVSQTTGMIHNIGRG
jgi:hypothetical protein